MPRGIYKRTKKTRLIIRNSRLGKRHSEKTKKKISKAHLGKKLSYETRQKIRKANMGDKNPSKRLEVRKKISMSKKGVKFTKEHIEKIRLGNFGKVIPEVVREKMRKNAKINPNYGMKGKRHSKSTKKKISEKKKGCKVSLETREKISMAFKGSKHPNWLGGKSFEPYGLEFNNDLREVIRNRDRRKCFICEKTELESGEKLHCHHIDYNKNNNNPNNLISLCRSCHMRTNYNREYWIDYFKEII